MHEITVHWGQMLNFLKPIVKVLAPDIRAKYRALELAQELGLKSDQPGRDLLRHERIHADVRAVCLTQGFDAFQSDYEAAFATKVRCESGHRYYAQMAGGLSDLPGGDDVQAFEAMCEHVREAWEDSGRSAFMGAIYGLVLFKTGYAWRGSDVASAVSQMGWAKLRSYTEQAHHSFFARQPGNDECSLWHRLLLQISISDGSSKQELLRRYERVMAFDPLDIWAPLGRAHQLLPRWHGSYEEIEVFAAQTANQTASDYGEAMYARIYAQVSDIAYEDMRNTIADPDRLIQGYRDWFSQTQSQYAANKHAAAAFLYGRELELADVVCGTMSEFHPDAWPGPQTAALGLQLAANHRRSLPPVSLAPLGLSTPGAPLAGPVAQSRRGPERPRDARVFGRRK